ncbi:hypothetical protein N0B40_13575 [Chryseobacterium oranimense]|uniref:hypothetical protein n=1 Tax=Chryseobacterium oranimense TaxID=421058 RepID=UPI0021B00613|nr:hypothetical protein [Chryseobacterium oranimense]UWX59437.1 hypothetical protein N0B40_13575 [Chryseobacterium oranimense]
MKKNLSIFLLFCLSLFCAGQNKKYAEIINSGYNGKIYSITIKIYNDSLEIKPIDSLISIRTRYYNKDGNATKELYQNGNDSQITDYEYKNGERTGYSLSKNGEVITNAEIIQQKTYHLINTYVLHTMLQSKEVYKYNSRFKIKTNDRTIYNNQNGKIKKHYATDYYYDKEGFISGYDIKDLLTSEITFYKFQILQKDVYKNPKKLLLLKNNIPFQIHLVDIEYYK